MRAWLGGRTVCAGGPAYWDQVTVLVCEQDAGKRTLPRPLDRDEVVGLRFDRVVLDRHLYPSLDRVCYRWVFAYHTNGTYRLEVGIQICRMSAAAVVGLSIAACLPAACCLAAAACCCYAACCVLLRCWRLLPLLRPRPCARLRQPQHPPRHPLCVQCRASPPGGGRGRPSCYAVDPRCRLRRSF